MKIKQQILDVIRKPVNRAKIAVRLGVGEQTIYQHVRANEVDGALTKMSALQIISEITGVPVLEVVENSEMDSEDTLSK